MHVHIGIEAGKGSVGTRDRKEGHTIDGVAGRPPVCSCLCSLVLVFIYYLIIGGFTLHKHYSRSSRARPFRGCALLGRARIGLATKQSQHSPSSRCESHLCDMLSVLLAW